MALRLTIYDVQDRAHEFFYKTVSKEALYAPISRKVISSRMDVDIKKVSDIERIRTYLDNLESAMNSQ